MNESIRTGYKILTHDWRPPIQGGEPLCDGLLSITLPTVKLDTGKSDCAQGYNYTGSLCEAAKIVSFWPGGRPAKCLVVSASNDAIQRQTKRRCSQITLERLCTEVEIQQAMRDLVVSWAGAYTDSLVQEQWLWYVALGRPRYDKNRVETALQIALEARGLKWTLKEFPHARAARDAWAARDARAARDAWDAWDALTLNAAVSLFDLQGYPANFFTLGIREAYLYGLEIVIPTGANELGWAMIPQ